MGKIIFIFYILAIGCSIHDKVETSKNTLYPEKRPVTFSYQPLIGGKHEVFLSGDFNNWSESGLLMEENNGIYEKTIFLKDGQYSYKFIVDGHWLLDQNADKFIEDGFGGQNSIIFVGNKKSIKDLRKVIFSPQPISEVKEVYLVGSMNDWNQNAHRMLKDEKGEYSISILLKPGEYQYKFVEDGMTWVVDKKAKSFVDDGFKGQNSVVIVNDSFKKIAIKKNDGLFLEYGIQTLQNLETVNPLSPIKIEFKAKAHRNDVEEIYLIKGDERIKMNNIAEDSSFDYFQIIINLGNENEEFDYCFVYHDGGKELYLLNGEFSKTNDKLKYFHYSKDNAPPFFTPDWVKNGVIYQIFLDRFYDGDEKNNPDFSEWYYEDINIPPVKGELHPKYTQYFHFVEDWYDVSGLVKSPFHASDKDGYQPDYNSFYGGDIEGVHQKLDYLVDLGITIIYFNPLFEAKSNHKYDAVDYMKIDPHFGTSQEFKKFVSEAHQRGIRIIIDCAFNHTGETFFAFQEGVKNGKDSKYYNWYEWKKWPLPDSKSNANYKPLDYYECWWGYGEMPNLNYDFSEINPSENAIRDIKLAKPNWEVVNYVLDVAEYWLSDMDIDGFRLDVPNEVPFWFWELFRNKVKSIKPDAYLVGELWSNAVDWVNDDYFDAVMNYAYFKDPVMRFFNMRKCDAIVFDRDLKQGLLSYPTQATQIMMNLIDSHDTHRYLESADGDILRLKMAVFFQMTYVGVPHIWYGDEIGMMGANDPDCRRPFNWQFSDDIEKKSLRDYYKKLITIRKENSCLRTGSFKTLIADGMVYGFIREDDTSSVAVIINNDTKTNKITIPIDKESVIELLSGKKYIIKDGKLEIELDAMSSIALR